MAISAKDVMALRKRSGLGMMECKQALTETTGDIDKAMDLLRERGLAKMDSRADRAASEGLIAIAISPDRTKGAIVEVNSETDFTAKNDAFKAMADSIAKDAMTQGGGDVKKSDAMQKIIDEVRLTTKENVQFARGKSFGGANSRVGSYLHFTGQIGVVVEADVSGGGEASEELMADLCMHIAAATPSPLSVAEDGVPADVLEKERQIAAAQAAQQNKPPQIAEKIVEGKVRKFYEEYVLLNQPFIKDDKKRIKDLLPKGVTIKQFVRYQLGDGAAG